MSTTKIVFGKTPETFKETVTFVTIDGQEAAIECEFKYRTKTAYWEWHEGVSAGGPNTKSLKKASEAGTNSTAAAILGCVKTWDLPVPVTEEHAKALCEEYPNAAAQILIVYREICTQGRQKN